MAPCKDDTHNSGIGIEVFKKFWEIIDDMGTRHWQDYEKFSYDEIPVLPRGLFLETRGSWQRCQRALHQSSRC